MNDIKDSDFEKLKQLDRIEYMLQNNNIDKQFDGKTTFSLTNFMVYLMLGVAAFLALAVPIYYLAFGTDYLYSLMSTFTMLIRILVNVAVVVVIVELLYAIYSVIKYRKAKTSLRNRFFNFLIKPKK